MTGIVDWIGLESHLLSTGCRQPRSSWDCRSDLSSRFERHDCRLYQDGLVVVGFDDSGSSQLVWSVGTAGWSVILSSSTTTTTTTAIAYYV